MLVRLSALALAAGLFSSSPAAMMAAALSVNDIPLDTPVSSLLSSAQTHLSRGQTGEALVYYDAAIARDPSNYLTFFKRATTFLSLGRTSQATDDFNKVLALKPDFEGAHVQLAKIKSRSADWDGAREHYLLARKKPDGPEMASIMDAQGASILAEEAADHGQWEECVNQAGVAIQMASRAAGLRELRARCRFEKGDMEEGMSDLGLVLQLKPGDTAPHVKISAITAYALGDLETAMQRTRKCLHSDQESKPCKKLLKQQKAIDKTLAKATKALDKNQPMSAIRMLVKTSDDEGLIEEIKAQDAELRASGVIPAQAPKALYTKVVEMACQGYYESNGKRAAEFCEEALQLNPDSFYGLLHSAKKLLKDEEYERCIDTLNKASEARPDKRDVVQPLMEKAQIALRRSKTKDYYKVLGVAHDADERQIKSAYRKLSKLHHPDKANKQGLTKEDAEKKMASINEAYEVLSNPELRARFDRGDDPNSPQGQQNFHGSPFGQGQPFMFQQGGSQFQFKFGGGGGGGGGGFPGGFPFG